MIIVNHLGFRPDDPLKRAVAPLRHDNSGFLGARLCRLIDVGTFVQHALNSPGGQSTVRTLQATIESTPLGEFAVWDLSAVTRRGGYQLLSDTDGASVPFLIYQDVWKRCFPLLLEWYRIASCGEAVPGYHERCHLDDCRLTTTGEHVDLVGGWHDAGDLRKWTSTMALVSQRLSDFVEEQQANPAAAGVNPDLVWRQLVRGATYLLKTVEPATGRVWHNVASEGDNSCNVWTDNVSGTDDDRRVDPTLVGGTPHSYVRAQCALARALCLRDPDLAESILDSARFVWSRLSGPAEPRDLIGTALELWRATGEAEFADVAQANLRIQMDRQCRTAMFGQDRVRGFLLDEGRIAYNGDFRGRGGRNVFAHMSLVEQLSRALLLWPRAADASRWRDALLLLLEGLAEPLLLLSPYRTLPACVYACGTGPRNGRELQGDLMFRYFGVEAEGDNFGLLESASALALAARALGQPKWAAYGQKQLEWVMGFNPLDTSMMTGLGYNHPTPFSFYVGQIPGGIINGFKGDPDDGPLLNRQREMEPMLMEYWSVHTAAMLRALSLLENEALADSL